RDQREKLLATGDSGICPTCARPLGDHFREVIELLDAQLDSVNADGTYFKGRLEQLEEMPSDVGALDTTRRQTQHEVSALERSLAKVQVRVAQIEQLGRELAIKEERLATVQRELAGIPAGYVKAQHDALEQEFERLAAMSTQANRLTLQVEREPVLKREQESTVRGLALLAEREALVRRDLQTTGLPDAEFGSLREAHATAEATARQAQVTALAAESERALAQAALDRALATRAELAAAVARLDALERDRRLHDELHRAYTDLRTDLNFALRPQLSALASTFLGDLTDARYTELELDDRYRIVVLEDGEPKPVISGGEEDVANLVLRLAISQMIAERAGQHFSLLVLDEVFASLDEARRVAVIELLRRLQDRFEQVILISHIESVRDLLDRVLEVRYDEQTGAARVTRGDALSFDALSGAA
ncbi:MAG: hypothetical protein K2X99_12860, partial [Gemmatimonadaceae bacterium]|nr:hypothetical protein [Gemmatimonadaceae bacterium]